MHPELSKPTSAVSGLLSAVCCLVGSQACHEYSVQNETLYDEVKEKLSLVMLDAPMDDADLWSMLILSTWSLGPETSGHFIDSWLLSGSTMLYSIQSYGFSTHGTTGSFDSQDQMTRNRILAWNASALLHLKSVPMHNVTEVILTSNRFSVGTCKPAVFATHTLTHFATTIQESQTCGINDKAAVIELELYALLYRCVVQQAVDISETKVQFQTWNAKHKDCSYPSQRECELLLTLVVLQRDATLQLGYTSAMLVLER